MLNVVEPIKLFLNFFNAIGFIDKNIFIILGVVFIDKGSPVRHIISGKGYPDYTS
jgi:hypothetical protein